EIHADQIADGIVVFGAVEPVNRDATRIGMFAIALEDFGLNPIRDQVPLGLSGLRFFCRRHFADANILQKFLPNFAVFEDRGFVGVNPQIQIALFLFAVATVAILAQQWLHVLLVGRGAF